MQRTPLALPTGDRAVVRRGRGGGVRGVGLTGGPGRAFHWKPGRRAAYAPLPVPTRPLAADVADLPPEPDWLETRRRSRDS